MDWRRVLYLIGVILTLVVGSGGVYLAITTPGCGCTAPPPPVTPPTQPTPPPDPPAPPPSPPDPPTIPPPDPVQATVRYRAGGVGCTATILMERPSSSQYWILTAAHCVRGTSGTGTIQLKDGRQYPFRAVRTNQAADIALLVTETADTLPQARISETTPIVGTEIWHEGYGIDRPGNREEGKVISGTDRNGQIGMRLSVSSGDSGSGIFRKDNGHLVSVVCCSGGGVTYGGSVEAIRRLILQGTSDDTVDPSDLADFVRCAKPDFPELLPAPRSR